MLKIIFTEVELGYLLTSLKELYIRIQVQRYIPVHKYARPEEIQLPVIGELTHGNIIRYIVLPEAIIQHYMEKGIMYQELTNSIYPDNSHSIPCGFVFTCKYFFLLVMACSNDCGV